MKDPNKWSTETVTVFNTSVTTITETIQTVYCYSSSGNTLIYAAPVCNFRRRRRSLPRLEEDEAYLLIGDQRIQPSMVEKLVSDYFCFQIQ